MVKLCIKHDMRVGEIAMIIVKAQKRVYAQSSVSFPIKKTSSTTDYRKNYSERPKGITANYLYTTPTILYFSTVCIIYD